MNRVAEKTFNRVQSLLEMQVEQSVSKSWSGPLSFLSGLGMTVCAALGIRHFYACNYAAITFEQQFCDINQHWNCDRFEYSILSRIAGVPLAYCGLVAGCFLCLASIMPSKPLQRTQRTIALLNVAIFSVLLFAATLYLKSVCVIGVAYWLFAAISLIVVAKGDSTAESDGLWRKWFGPAPRILVVILSLGALGAYGFRAFTRVKDETLAERAVDQYSRLARVKLPSFLSPYWIARSTDRFEDAPIQVVEFSDLLCNDSVYNEQQLQRLKEDFKGKINIIWQFFPLEAKCNQVAAKDKHPGACEAAYMAAYQPSKFLQLHDDFLAHWKEGSDPEWRRKLAQKYGVEKGLTDPPTQELVHRIIQTGAEYEPTSTQYSYGIRSVPTLIVNNRLIIGTFSYPQLRAIFQRIVDEKQNKAPRFIESWPR